MQASGLFQIRFVANMVCFLPLPVLLMVEGIYSGKNGVNYYGCILLRERYINIIF
jgi:hypothetical protein